MDKIQLRKIAETFQLILPDDTPNKIAYSYCLALACGWMSENGYVIRVTEAINGERIGYVRSRNRDICMHSILLYENEPLLELLAHAVLAHEWMHANDFRQLESTDDEMF